jgi:hypothetical protein
MARTTALLPAGTRLSDYISLGLLARAVPLKVVNSTLAQAKKASRRERDLPAYLVVYYVMTMAVYMQSSYREVLRCLLEGLLWLAGSEVKHKLAGKSGISQARRRLGWEPMQRLHDKVVAPIATTQTKGACYRRWRLVSLDGSTLEVADTTENAAAFGRPKNQKGAGGYPQLRFVSLVENGTHVLFASREGSYKAAEVTLAREVVGTLRPGMLCLAVRLFLGYELWNKAQATGADLLWRVGKTFLLPCQQRLEDGSYLSRLYRSSADRQKQRGGILVRVIEYQLHGIAGAEPSYRIATTILEPKQAPAQELAALYHERWELETAFDELKTHLRGAKIVLRSKTPDLVRQEFYGLLLTHFAIRSLMHEAALRGKEDPDRLSYLHAVRIARRKLPHYGAIPPSRQKDPA